MLHDPAGLERVHGVIEHQQPAVAVGVDAEIGDRGAGISGDARADQHVSVEELRGQAAHINAFLLLGLHQHGMGRDHDLAGEGGDPFARNGSDGGPVEGLRIGAGAGDYAGVGDDAGDDEGEPDELGVALEAQAERPEIGAVVPGADFGRGHAELIGQLADGLDGELALARVAQQRQVRYPHRGDERLGRAGMDLVV